MTSIASRPCSERFSAAITPSSVASTVTDESSTSTRPVPASLSRSAASDRPAAKSGAGNPAISTVGVTCVPRMWNDSPPPPCRNAATSSRAKSAAQLPTAIRLNGMIDPAS